MDKRENVSSQIYLLSLDTFMIMTVMGITLGIIFFILNPKLNEGVGEYEGEKYYIKKEILLAVSKKLNQKTDCDNFFESAFCTNITDQEKMNYLEIQYATPNCDTCDYELEFVLFDKKGEIIKSGKKTRDGIQGLGLGFLKKKDSE